MKKKLVLLFYFSLITLFIFSVSVSIWSVLTNNYFSDYNNYISLKEPKRYMEVDTLLLKKIENYSNMNDNAPGKDIVYGTSIKTKNEIKIVIGKKEYLNCFFDKCPIYRSRLTGDCFLKDANSKYYRRQFRSQFLTMFLKACFFPMILTIIYIIYKYKL